MKKTTLLIILIVLLGLLSACSLLPDAWTATPTPEPTATPTPAPTPSPTPVPTPSPTPDPGPYGDGAYVTERYDIGFPDGLTTNFIFNHSNQERFLDYVVVMSDGFIYPEMDASAEPMAEADYSERYLVSAKLVKGEAETGTWYRIHWTKTVDDEEVMFTGYISDEIADYREFQIEAAYADVLFLAGKIDEGEYSYVVNRSNEVSKSSDIDMPYDGQVNEFGKPVDDYGTLQDQASPVFENEDMTGAYRYAPDGSLADVLSVGEAMCKIYLPEFDGTYYIPREYLRRSYAKDDIAIEKLSEVAVVDRKNQNIMYFELSRETDEWELLSMSYVSTGTSSEYADPTPLGYFAVQKTRSTQPYPSDTTGVEAGYMPYAIRFSGGAYMHGVPVNYTVDANGNLVKPGPRESHISLGVQPESHMCVRNYTTHGKFLFGRISVGKAAVIVIE